MFEMYKTNIIRAINELSYKIYVAHHITDWPPWPTISNQTM